VCFDPHPRCNGCNRRVAELLFDHSSCVCAGAKCHSLLNKRATWVAQQHCTTAHDCVSFMIHGVIDFHYDDHILMMKAPLAMTKILLESCCSWCVLSICCIYCWLIFLRILLWPVLYYLTWWTSLKGREPFGYGVRPTQRTLESWSDIDLHMSDVQLIYMEYIYIYD
jgi:hypothetical protein